MQPVGPVVGNLPSMPASVLAICWMFSLHGFMASDTLTMEGILVVSKGLIFVDGFAIFFSGQRAEVVAAACQTAGNGFRAVPCVVAVVAGKSHVLAMGEFHSRPSGLHCIRWFQRDDPHGDNTFPHFRTTASSPSPAMAIPNEAQAIIPTSNTIPTNDKLRIRFPPPPFRFLSGLFFDEKSKQI